MWSCPPVLCAGRDRARASGGRKKLNGATLASSRVAPSDRAGPGWVPGWRLELADRLVAVRSWLLHEPDLGLANDDGVRDWRGTRQRVNRPSRFGQESRISGVVERYCVIPFLLPPPKNPCPTRAEEASQAGRRRFDPGRPLLIGFAPSCLTKHVPSPPGTTGSREPFDQRAQRRQLRRPVVLSQRDIGAHLRDVGSRRRRGTPNRVTTRDAPTVSSRRLRRP